MNHLICPGKWGLRNPERNRPHSADRATTLHSGIAVSGPPRDELPSRKEGRAPHGPGGGDHRRTQGQEADASTASDKPLRF
jgi:hypothetical protein